ncbi:unnamed protein product [marine sediment metagenome]|uniref:Uncharacterized protein n=1 Tax=marine sediment metagenome TaxID=412755 RepID=X1JKE5_9ZZZZ
MKVLVIVNGKKKEVECDLMKLSRTMYNIGGGSGPGDSRHYTEKEMFQLGFQKKGTESKLPCKYYQKDGNCCVHAHNIDIRSRKTGQHSRRHLKRCEERFCPVSKLEGGKK